MFVIGIFFFILSLFLPRILWKTDDIIADVPDGGPKENQERRSAITVQDYGNLSQRKSMSQSEDELNATEIDEIVEWLESLGDETLQRDEELAFEFDDDFSDDFTFYDEPENHGSEFDQTHVDQRVVDSIVQRIYDGTDEYRGLIEILYADVPWTPEFQERRLQAQQRRDELESEFPNLVAKYFMLTQDMDSLEQLLPLFEGVIEIEFTPPVNGGGLFSMDVIPIRDFN